MATRFLEAQIAPPPHPPTPIHSVVVGPWIVGGIGLSVLSVIGYAAVINAQQHRELTSAEAIGAITFPFGWILVSAFGPPTDVSLYAPLGPTTGSNAQLVSGDQQGVGGFPVGGVSTRAITMPPR
jgi:hypothetical protein